MVEGLKKGDKVVTSGGITGTITRVVDNDKVEVEIPGVGLLRNNVISESSL